MIAQTLLLAVLLVTTTSAEQQPQGEVVPSNVQSVPVVHHGEPQDLIGVAGPHQGVVGAGPVEHQHHQHQQVVSHVQSQQYPQYGVGPAPASYAPAGVIQMVGVEPQIQSGIVKPQQQGQYSAGAVVAPQQYGQPESAAIPANYKPWGSWGLYIGGNPADGYYSSYYKALSQSVADKQQVGGSSSSAVAPSSQVGSDSVKPGSPQALVSQASGFAGSQSPMLKQGPGVVSGASSFPYSYQDSGYPYDSSSYYTPADLNSGSRVSVVPQGHPVQFVPADSYPIEQPVGGLSYAAPLGAYQYASTKRSGGQAPSYPTKSDSQVRQEPIPQAPAKGYYSQQQRAGYYSYAAGSPLVYQQAPASPQNQHQQHQVVAYPVPVGSQIVGSQPGEGAAFQPYGVHGFTRYAIKPTVVSSPVPVESQQQPYDHQHQHSAGQGVHSAPVGQFPVYKQLVGYQQPLSFYGYPLSQLHYSQGSISPVQFESSPSQGSSISGISSSGSVSQYAQEQPQSPVQGPVVSHSPLLGMPAGYQVEAAGSEKSESKVEPKSVAETPVAKPTGSKPVRA